MSRRKVITSRVKTAEWLKSIEREIVSVFLVPNDQVLLFNYGCLLQIILACCSSRGEGGDQRTEAGRTSEERERRVAIQPSDAGPALRGPPSLCIHPPLPPARPLLSPLHQSHGTGGLENTAATSPRGREIIDTLCRDDPM